MAKPLFKNYTYTFDKNEKKILLNFCKTLLKQMTADENFFADVRSFNSIVDKLNSNDAEIKLTKEEKRSIMAHKICFRNCLFPLQALFLEQHFLFSVQQQIIRWE